MQKDKRSGSGHFCLIQQARRKAVQNLFLCRACRADLFGLWFSFLLKKFKNGKHEQTCAMTAKLCKTLLRCFQTCSNSIENDQICQTWFLTHLKMSSVGRNVPNISETHEITRAHAWRTALRGRSRLMVHRTFKHLANAVTAAGLSLFQTAESLELIGTSHLEPPERSHEVTGHHRGRCSPWSQRGRWGHRSR